MACEAHVALLGMFRVGFVFSRFGLFGVLDLGFWGFSLVCVLGFWDVWIFGLWSCGFCWLSS